MSGVCSAPHRIERTVVMTVFATSNFLSHFRLLIFNAGPVTSTEQTASKFTAKMKKKSIKKLSIKSSLSFEEEDRDLQNVDIVINILKSGRPAQQVKWWIQTTKAQQGEEDVIAWMNMTKISSRKQMTPLDYSIFHCSEEVVRVLLDEGAVPTESSLICAREKLPVLSTILEHRKPDGSPTLSNDVLTIWVFNHITRANQHSQTRQEFWPVAQIVEQELLARDMYGVILLPFAAECSKFLSTRKEISDDAPVSLLHTILWIHDLSDDSYVDELLQVVEPTDDRLPVSQTNCQLP